MTYKIENDNRAGSKSSLWYNGGNVTTEMVHFWSIDVPWLPFPHPRPEKRVWNSFFVLWDSRNSTLCCITLPRFSFLVPIWSRPHMRWVLLGALGSSSRHLLQTFSWKITGDLRHSLTNINFLDSCASSQHEFLRSCNCCDLLETIEPEEAWGPTSAMVG